MLMLMMQLWRMAVGVRDCRVCMLMTVLADHRFGVEMVMMAVIMAMPVLMGFP